METDGDWRQKPNQKTGKKHRGTRAALRAHQPAGANKNLASGVFKSSGPHGFLITGLVLICGPGERPAPFFADHFCLINPS
jgi:hypothetical protein